MIRSLLLASLIVGGCVDDRRTGSRRDSGRRDAAADSGSDVADDDGLADVTLPDGAPPDADVPDSGLPDLSTPDAGPDATPDASGPDGDIPDVAVDRGPDATDTCEGIDLRSDVGEVATGTTSGASSRTPSCGSSSTAPEAFFFWVAPSAGSWTIDTNGSAFDTILDVLDASVSCDSPPVIECDDDGGDGTQSLVTITLSAGQRIVIIVDGYTTRSGAFTLNINPA